MKRTGEPTTTVSKKPKTEEEEVPVPGYRYHHIYLTLPEWSETKKISSLSSKTALLAAAASLPPERQKVGLSGEDQQTAVVTAFSGQPRRLETGPALLRAVYYVLLHRQCRENRYHQGKQDPNTLAALHCEQKPWTYDETELLNASLWLQVEDLLRGLLRVLEYCHVNTHQLEDHTTETLLQDVLTFRGEPLLTPMDLDLDLLCAVNHAHNEKFY